MFDVVILAGGRGTRLSSLAKTDQKVVVRMNNKPFLEYVLDQLSAFQPNKIVISVGYQSDQVISALEEYALKHDNIIYSVDDEGRTDTGFAVHKASELVENNFWVLNGDTIQNIDYHQIEKSHLRMCRCATSVTYRNNNLLWPSNMQVKNGLVTKYSKTAINKTFSYIDTGAILFNRTKFSRIPKFESLPRYLEHLADTRELAAFETFTRFYEINTPGTFLETELALANGFIHGSNSISKS